MAKNFDDVSCFYCGTKNHLRDTQCSECKSDLGIIPMLLDSKVGNYTLIEFKGRGFYGLTFKAKDNYGKEYALKVISKNSYFKFNKHFEDEAALYAKLPSMSSIVSYVAAGESTVSVAERSIAVYYIVSNWVSGATLKEFLDESEIYPEDLVVAARDLLSGLQALYDSYLWHNDLHDENVMVSVLASYELAIYQRSIPRIYKIIDVGNMVYRNPADVKQYSDMMNVGNHLSLISRKLKEDYGTYCKEDQFFIELMDEIILVMTDEHPSRGFHTPLDALHKIEEVYRLSRIGEIPQRSQLDNPYGYINANDITSPWLLKNLFSDKLSYFKNIMSVDHQTLLITGPRGCGKTMILKNMRFNTLSVAYEGTISELLKDLRYVGLFVSARTNFGNYLVSYRAQNWSNSEETIVLYFNMLVTLELINILYQFDVTSDAAIDTILRYIAEQFGIPNYTKLTLKSSLVRLSKRLISDEAVTCTPQNSTPAYLNDLIRIFRAAIPEVRDKEIIILIDDLTLPRIPIPIQKALIPLIYNTGASYKVRVTAHSDGIVFQDLAKEVYKENRDYQHVNLGWEYWQLSDNYIFCRECFDDILKKRFEMSGRSEFPGLEAILGVGDKLDDIGREIHKLSQSKTLRTLKYHGCKVFIKLCSGDLSYLLDILGKMEIHSKGRHPINVSTQSGIIKNYARNELRGMQDIRATSGISLYDVSYYFGIWSKSKLIKHNKDYIKIEVELQGLSDRSRDALRDLLCYGVFVDGGYSNMNDQQIARKLLFRRIFTPAFPTTFNSRNTFPMVPWAFENFISSPKDFVKAKMSEDRIPPEEQLEIEQLELDFDEIQA